MDIFPIFDFQFPIESYFCDRRDGFEALADGEVLGAAGFAFAALDAGGRRVGREGPMPLQAIGDGLVFALEHFLVVGVHHLGDLDIRRAGQAIAATRAEPLETVGDMRLHALDVLGRIGLEVFHGGDRLIDLGLVLEAHQGCGDGGLRDVEANGGLHPDVAIVGALDEGETLGISRVTAAEELVHGDDADVVLRGGLEALARNGKLMAL